MFGCFGRQPVHALANSAPRFMYRAPSVFVFRALCLGAVCGLAVWNGWSASDPTTHPAARKTVTLHKSVANHAALVKVALAIKPARKTPVDAPGIVAGGPWKEPTYADSTAGDRV